MRQMKAKQCGKSGVISCILGKYANMIFQRRAKPDTKGLIVVLPRGVLALKPLQGRHSRLLKGCGNFVINGVRFDGRSLAHPCLRLPPFLSTGQNKSQIVHGKPRAIITTCFQICQHLANKLPQPLAESQTLVGNYESSLQLIAGNCRLVATVRTMLKAHKADSESRKTDKPVQLAFGFQEGTHSSASILPFRIKTCTVLGHQLSCTVPERASQCAFRIAGCHRVKDLPRGGHLTTQIYGQDFGCGIIRDGLLLIGLKLPPRTVTEGRSAIEDV